MQEFRLIGRCGVESPEGSRVVPAGLFKYRFEQSSLRTSHIHTFWIDFGLSPRKAKAILIHIYTPLTWDNGEPISEESGRRMLFVLEQSFLLKGFEVHFELHEGEHSVPESSGIEETEGGKFLEEASKRLDLSDDERAVLWARAKQLFVERNHGDVSLVSNDLRPSPKRK